MNIKSKVATSGLSLTNSLRNENFWSRKGIWLGFLDSSVCFSYLIGVPVEIWYSLVIFAKLVTLALSGGSASGSKIAFPIVLMLLPSLIITLINDGGLTDSSLGVFAFCVSLFLSLMLIRTEDTRGYLAGMGGVGLIGSSLYILLAFLGLVEQHYGRYMFWGDNHPNLGSETFVAFLLAGVVVFNKKSVVILFVLTITCIILMQARAALLVALSGAGFYLYFLFKERVIKLEVVVVFVLFLTLVSVVLSVEILGLFNQVFLVEDVNRGIGTGFVGRGERWAQAIELFYSNPWFGGGFSAFDVDGLLTPHNFVLAGLAYMGVLSLIFYFYLLFCFGVVWKHFKKLALAMVPLVFFVIFNDRFVNMNPYPFCFYVLLLSEAGVSVRRKELRSFGL